MRLSSVIENDIAALETAHRGYLLTAGIPRRTSNAAKTFFKERIEDLTAALIRTTRGNASA